MHGDIRNNLRTKVAKNRDGQISEGNFTVSEIFEKKEGFINPVIVIFQNGELNEQHASQCKVTFTSDKNGRTYAEVETSSGHVFKDSNFGESQQQNQFIAVRNRKTNKVRLVEVDHSVLINSALLSAPRPTATVDSAAHSGNTEVRSLNRIFGTRRIKNRLMQKEKLSLSALPVADEVEKTVKEMKVEDVSFNSTETESILHLLPPCNRDSAVLSNVYNISEILTETELEALKEEVGNVMEGNKFNSAEFSPFVVSCHSDVKNSHENIKEKLAGILFVEILIRFLKMPSKKLAVKKLVLCSFSTVIHDKLLNEFCIKTETSVTRPLTMRDKILCYIIILCLICCGYQVNLKLLATTTSVNFIRLGRLAQVVGAVPLSKKDGVFVLKLPLPPLPKSKTRIKKK